MPEDINIQFRPPIVSYKFFHKAEYALYSVDTIIYTSTGYVDSVFVSKRRSDNKQIIVGYDIKDGELIQSTEIYAKDYAELFYGDLVNWNHNGVPELCMVFWDNGWRVYGCTTEEFVEEAQKNMEYLGNKFEQEDLYLAYIKRITDGKKS